MSANSSAYLIKRYNKIINQLTDYSTIIYILAIYFLAHVIIWQRLRCCTHNETGKLYMYTRSSLTKNYNFVPQRLSSIAGEVKGTLRKLTAANHQIRIQCTW